MPHTAPAFSLVSGGCEAASGSFLVPSFELAPSSFVEAEITGDPGEVRSLLKRQLTSPVRWVEVIERLRGEGVETVIEIGHGKVLTGLVKRIDKSIEGLNFGSVEDLDRLKEALELP